MKSLFRGLWLTDLSPSRRAALMERIRLVERPLILPIKVVVLGALLWFLFFSKTFSLPPPSLAATKEYLKLFFLAYAAFSLGTGIIIWGMDEVAPLMLERVVYSVVILDAVMMAGVIILTNGFNSSLYWICFTLVFRCFGVISHADVQLVLNLITSGCFVLGGLLYQFLDPASDFGPAKSNEGSFGQATAVETIFLRTLLLVLTSVCCYAIQVLGDRKRTQAEEAEQFALKQHQLAAAGRLAGEIAHQLKNPLGIINNAAYTLAKTVKEGKTITQQISIIREEVARSDRIITELMGYARLAEGRLERVNLIRELETAVNDVFPPGSSFEVEIRREYGPLIPEIPGQTGHFREVFANLLINAREAMNGRGEIVLSARSDQDLSAWISVRDNGPGIPPTQINQIFEPYFTTKPTGTGLGLAIVKHNTELYGGVVQVESVLGRGTTFTVKFPARSLVRLRK